MRIVKNFNSFINELYRIQTYSNTGRTKFIDTILDDPSSDKALSSGILLKKKLMDEEVNDILSDIPTDIPDKILKSIKASPSREKIEKIKISINNFTFLKNQLKKGPLHCEYCNKGPLKLYRKNFNMKDGATCDHKEPISRGGDKFNYSNLCVCCHKCNAKKSNMSYKEWMQIK